MSSAGLACSPVDGYHVPTNIELIEGSDLVVLAKVISGPDTFDDTKGFEPLVVLEPVRTLKGGAPQNLRVFGTLRDRSGEPYVLAPTPLSGPHPSSLWGGCIRQAYSLGGLVVAMFKKTPEGYAQVGAPFARSVEDVEGPNALWVRTAELYERMIAETPPSERRKAFEAERDRLLKLHRDVEAQQVAADITNYLEATAKN